MYLPKLACMTLESYSLTVHFVAHKLGDSKVQLSNCPSLDIFALTVRKCEFFFPSLISNMVYCIFIGRKIKDIEIDLKAQMSKMMSQKTRAPQFQKEVVLRG